MEAKEYARDKIDAAKWQERYGNENDGSGKFWRRNAKLQTFLDENLKTSSDNRYDSDSETSC